MKTNVCKTASFLLIVVMLASLFSCKDESQMMTFVIGGDSPSQYEIYLDEFDNSQGLISILEHLREKVKLNYEIKDGKLVKLGALEYNTGDGTDICIYTSVESDISKASDRYTVDYKGVTYAETGVALKNMTLEPGAVIYVGLLRYQ